MPASRPARGPGSTGAGVRTPTSSTATGEPLDCPVRHVPRADKVLKDGGEAFTVADFHPIADASDPASDQPRVRIGGAYVLGENGAGLRLLRGVPAGDRLNCDTGGTAYAARLVLSSVNEGDVIVARTSEYVGKLEVTGGASGALYTSTTSYFMPQG